jgi:hypothetical protein
MSTTFRSGNRSSSKKTEIGKSELQSTDEDERTSKNKGLSISKRGSIDEESSTSTDLKPAKKPKGQKKDVDKVVSMLLTPIDIIVFGNSIKRSQISLLTYQDIIKGFTITSQRSITEIKKSAETYDELESVVTSHFTSSSVILICVSSVNTRGTLKHSSLEILYIPEQSTSSSSTPIVAQDIADSIIRYTCNHEELNGKVAVLFFPAISDETSNNHTGNNSKVC